MVRAAARSGLGQVTPEEFEQLGPNGECAKWQAEPEGGKLEASSVQGYPWRSGDSVMQCPRSTDRAGGSLWRRQRWEPTMTLRQMARNDFV